MKTKKLTTAQLIALDEFLDMLLKRKAQINSELFLLVSLVWDELERRKNGS